MHLLTLLWCYEGPLTQAGLQYSHASDLKQIIWLHIGYNIYSSLYSKNSLVTEWWGEAQRQGCAGWWIRAGCRCSTGQVAGEMTCYLTDPGHDDEVTGDQGARNTWTMERNLYMCVCVCNIHTEFNACRERMELNSSGVAWMKRCMLVSARELCPHSAISHLDLCVCYSADAGRSAWRIAKLHARQDAGLFHIMKLYCEFYGLEEKAGIVELLLINCVWWASECKICCFSWTWTSFFKMLVVSLDSEITCL